MSSFAPQSATHELPNPEVPSGRPLPVAPHTPATDIHSALADLERELHAAFADRARAYAERDAAIAERDRLRVELDMRNCALDQTAARDLESLLGLYQREIEGLPPAGALLAARERLRAAETRADLEFLRDEVQKAIERALDGIDRVTHIVRAIKEFAHPQHVGASGTTTPTSWQKK